MTEGFAAIYHADGLPDPIADRQFYDGVPTRRLVAWLFDTIIIGAISIAISLFTLGLLFFVFPLVFMLASFFYRWLTIAARSSTPGMRLTGIEFRDRQGEKFSSGQAAGHTLLYHLTLITGLAQLISIILMLLTAKGQGLPDLLLGSTAINRPE